MEESRLLTTKHAGDYWVILSTMILSLIGLIAVYSASYYTALNTYGEPGKYLKNDLAFTILGWLVFVFCATMDYHTFKRGWIPWIILIAGMVLLGLVFIVGSTINNATRWIKVGNLFTIMPGEIIKSSIIVFYAYYYGDDPGKIRSFRHGVVPGFFVAGVCFIMICLQPNLSTAGIVVLLAVGIMFIAGVQFYWILGAAILGVIAFLIVISLPSGAYMLERVKYAFDPFEDALGSGYQVVQGLLAFGSGGVKGVGIGKSIQKTLYLPEPQSDFILPVIGEEIGYIGVIALLILFLFLIWRCFRVTTMAGDRFGMLLAGGISLHLALQVILNVAVVTATFFPTGVVLPFISLGGNALLLDFAEMGILYNISRTTVDYGKLLSAEGIE